MLGQNYKLHGLTGAFPSHRNTRDASPRLYTREARGKSCISFPSVLLLPFSLHDNHTHHTIHNTLSTCIPPAAVVSLLSPSPSICLCPFFVHLTHNGSVAYLETTTFQSAACLPTTPPQVNKRRQAVLHSSAGLARLKADPVHGNKQTATSRIPHGPDSNRPVDWPARAPFDVPSDSPRRGRLRDQQRRRTQATTWRTRGSK